MGPGPEIMKKAAASGCVQTEMFDQMDLIRAQNLPEKMRGGICYGLAVGWLDRKAKGQGHYLQDLKARGENLLSEDFLQRAMIMYEKQLHGGDVMTALFPALTDNDWEDRWFNLGNGSGADDLAKYLASGKKSGFYLLHVMKHTMAATGGGSESLRFFDPNSGVVKASNAHALSAFFKAYFNDPTINQKYTGLETSRFGASGLKLRAERYTKFS